jgi:hypothetical protein
LFEPEISGAPVDQSASTIRSMFSAPPPTTANTLLCADRLSIP